MTLARALLSTGTSSIVSGALFGTGSLSIPAGVVLVTLTGQGGLGTYDPGQEYIPPSGYHPEVVGYQTWGAPYSATGSQYGPASPSLTSYGLPSSDPGGSGTSTTPIGGVGVMSSVWQTFDGTYYYVNSQAYFMTLLTTVPTVPAYYDDPGQPYIAPSEGYGANTTATLNGFTDTWVGGLGVVIGPASTQTLTSTGAGQTMTYVVGSGGNLVYSYTI